MKLLKYGSSGPEVSLLQLALKRFGYTDLCTDGIFGNETKAALTGFQSTKGLIPDGICGKLSHNALFPWYSGYFIHKIQTGDSLFSLALRYGSSVTAIKTANPKLVPQNLRPGGSIVIPFDFPVVPDNINYCSELVRICISGLSARYPFLKVRSIGKSVMGKDIYALLAGEGDNRVIYNACHHANEWITGVLLLKFVENLCRAFSENDEIYGQKAAEILKYSTICVIPVVNPDGLDLVTGELKSGEFYRKAKLISSDYPRFSFPSGWKANISGVDLNLQYPAGWEQARENKFKQGIVSPSPCDFVGNFPLSAPESRAMYDFTISFRPSLILAYHTQGRLIYWKYLDYKPEGSEEIAELFSTISSYPYENTPYSSGFAGYKDWFIEAFNSPGYTVEAGQGINPLPISDFGKIYEDNIGILTRAALVT